MQATFFDGETARPHPVRVDLGDGTLTITGEDGRVLAGWPAADVRLVATAGNGTVTLRCGTAEPARLVLAGSPGDRAALARFCPDLRRTDRGEWRTWRQVGIWAVGAIASVVLLIQVVIPALAAEIAAVIPPEAERRLGDAVADDLIQAFSGGADPPVCTGEAGQAALEDLSRRLVAGLTEPLHLRVRVVNTGEVNALALPGGQILILRGLIEEARSPDEVAGVLAHEIAHIARRHPTTLSIQYGAVSVLVGLLVGDVTGGTVIAGLGTVLIGASYSRDFEREADALGAELLTHAKISTGGLAAFFRRLRERQGELEEAIGFLNTHPVSADRLAALPPDPVGAGTAISEPAWQAIRTMCE